MGLVCVHPLGLHVNLRNVAQVVERSLWEREVRGFEPRHSDWVSRREPVRGLGSLDTGVTVRTCGRMSICSRMDVVSGL